MLSIPQKRCTSCKNYYPLGAFTKAKQYKDGLSIYCKKCWAEKKGRVWHPECLIPDGYRQCGHCSDVLPTTDEYFNRNKNCKGGWSNKCKACSAKYDAQWLENNREYSRAKSKERYYSKPEARKKYKEDHKEQIAATKKAYRKAHPEETRKHKSESQKRNRGSANLRGKRSRERYPEIARLRGRIAAMKRRVKVGDFTRAELMDLYHEQNERCAYCGISIYWHIPHDIHVDHIVPVTKGGTNELENLALTCADCNLSKHDLLLADWLLVRGW